MNSEKATPSSPVDAVVLRPLLRDWMKEHWPDSEQWRYANAAQDQITWVRNHLAYMAWNSLLPPPPKDWSIDEREATLTVDGTHTSKSVLLPVYRFDMGGVITKIRGNFHDWCVRCWAPLKREFPEWMNVEVGGGCYEGMEGEDSPVAFCVPDRERLFAVLWWMYHEGIDT